MARYATPSHNVAFHLLLSIKGFQALNGGFWLFLNKIGRELRTHRHVCFMKSTLERQDPRQRGDRGAIDRLVRGTLYVLALHMLCIRDARSGKA